MGNNSILQLSVIWSLERTPFQMCSLRRFPPQRSKPNATPPTCALCGGDHTANYSGCPVHKNLQRSSPKPNIVSKNHVNKNSIVNKQKAGPCDQLHPNPSGISDKKSFPNLTQNFQIKQIPIIHLELIPYDNILGNQLYIAYNFFYTSCKR